jgi:hypothetical protein
MPQIILARITHWHTFIAFHLSFQRVVLFSRLELFKVTCIDLHVFFVTHALKQCWRYWPLMHLVVGYVSTICQIVKMSELCVHICCRR